ncbi:MAG: protein kinase [Verrucomicrobiales bacterium]|nr:protein kinase [Verrucomicrobiales bacterium]
MDTSSTADVRSRRPSDDRSPAAESPDDGEVTVSYGIRTCEPPPPDKFETRLPDRDAVRADEEIGDLPEYVGPFRVVEVIGRGGMGVVARAWDSQLRRHVAIKFLHRHFVSSSELTKQFFNEAYINGRLEHPSIISVHGVGKCADGRPFFVMRLVEGVTLRCLLAGGMENLSHQLSLLRVFEKIADGVAFAHSQGIIHRDLKPSNIIVGCFGAVKIMDWGLAKSLRDESGYDPEWSSAPIGLPQGEGGGCDDDPLDSVVGTPAYVAPEQARGETTVDERADVFSLGAILCHILTGADPYSGTQGSKLEEAMSGNVGPALERLEACAAEREVIDLAKSCLAPDKTRRPRNGSEVASAITRYLDSDLRRAERELVRFFELSLDLFCIAGLDGYFKRVNANFTRVLGHSTAELLSRPFVDFVHPEDLQATAGAMETLGNGRPVVQFTNRYLHADGRYLHLEWAAKMEDVRGGTIYAVAREVTGCCAARLPQAAMPSI